MQGRQKRYHPSFRSGEQRLAVADGRFGTPTGSYPDSFSLGTISTGFLQFPDQGGSSAFLTLWARTAVIGLKTSFRL